MTQTFLCLYVSSLFLLSTVLYAWIPIPKLVDHTQSVHDENDHEHQAE